MFLPGSTSLIYLLSPETSFNSPVSRGVWFELLANKDSYRMFSWKALCFMEQGELGRQTWSFSATRPVTMHALSFCSLGSASSLIIHTLLFWSWFTELLLGVTYRHTHARMCARARRQNPPRCCSRAAGQCSKLLFSLHQGDTTD